MAPALAQAPPQLLQQLAAAMTQLAANLQALMAAQLIDGSHEPPASGAVAADAGAPAGSTSTRSDYAIHAHFTGQPGADGIYRAKRKSYDPAKRTIIDNATGNVSKFLIPRTQPEDHAKAAAFLEQVMANAPRSVAELAARGYVQKDAEHWVNSSLNRDGRVGDPTVPEYYMVRDGKIVGAVFGSYGAPDAGDLPDFGLGGWHVHPHVPYATFDPAVFAARKATRMQHVMFRPDDLHMAFMDGQFMGDMAH